MLNGTDDLLYFYFVPFACWKLVVGYGDQVLFLFVLRHAVLGSIFILCSPYRLSTGSLWAATIQAKITDYQNDQILKWLPAIVTVYAGKNGGLAIARGFISCLYNLLYMRMKTRGIQTRGMEIPINK